MALSDSHLHARFGLFGTMRIYKYVNQFKDNMKKRVRNNKYKKKVVEEIIKTEENYINGLEIMIAWKATMLGDEILNEDEI